jgi:VWFA-related protein
VDQQMQPGDLVAIIRTGAGMGALQQFTSDKNQLHAAIDRVKFNSLGRGGAGAFAPVGREDGGSAGMADFRDEYFTRGTIGALNYVIAGLKEMPGRKAVVLLSDSIRLFNEQGLNDVILESMRKLTDAANRASVVIYGIDARGLPTLSLTAEDNPRGRDNGRGGREALTGPALASIQQKRHEDYFQSQDGLNYLAQETGGLFVHDTNDISGGMRKVLDDQRGYYLVGYTPDDATFQELKDKTRKYHKLSLKVRKPGLSIRTRTGFFGIPDRNTKPVYRTRGEQLFAALGSPFGGGAVHLRLTALFAHNAKEGSFVQSLLHIEAKDLTFTDEPDDWHKAVVDILLVTFSDSGAEMDQSSKTYTVRLHGATYRNALEHGFVDTVNHLVKKPGAYQLRAAVRDAATEKIGSASQFIEVPDLTKGHLTVSGLVVRASRPPASPAPAAGEATPPQAKSEQAQKEETEIESLGNPAVRMFRPGRRLDYALQILNSQLDSTTKRPQLETQLLLFHDGQKIYEGKPKQLEPEALPDSTSVVTAGQLQLGGKMEPGEYAMQIVVTDKLAKEKYRTVAQSIDFEVVK